MKAAAERIEALSQQEIQGLLDGATLSIEVNGKNVDLTAEKLDIRRIEKAQVKVLNEGTLTVGLDMEVTEELAQEGDVRDLVRGIQNLRKESGFDVTDRIKLTLFGSDKLKSAFKAFTDYIAQETLAVSIEWKEVPSMTEVEAGDESWKVALEKA